MSQVSFLSRTVTQGTRLYINQGGKTIFRMLINFFVTYFHVNLIMNVSRPWQNFLLFVTKFHQELKYFGLCSIHNRSIIGIFVIYWKLESGAGTDYRLSPIVYCSKTINSSFQRFYSVEIFKSIESIFSILIRWLSVWLLLWFCGAWL